MRILHIVTAFPRTASDVIAPWLVEMLRRLRTAGHEVEVLTSAYRGGGNRVFDGIPIYRFRYWPARWEDLTHDEATPDKVKRSLRYRLMVPCYVIAGMWAAWRLGRQGRYDIIHVHWPLPHVVFGWMARRASHARLVTTFYGVELRWVKTGLPVLAWFLAWAARTSDRVVAISQYTRTEILELADVKVTVIPYASGLSVAPAPSRAASGAGLQVLFVGRLVERKGIPVLLEAIRRLASQDDVQVTIVGDGPERPRLERMTRDLALGTAVHFWGRVPGAELADAYARADVAVLPAIRDARGDTEGLGVVLLEAMSYGVPVVASDIGGIRDIVTHDRTGFLVPPGDAQALADALHLLIRDRQLAARLGTAGQRHYTEHFSWDAIMERWEKLYASLLVRPDDGEASKGTHET